MKVLIVFACLLVATSAHLCLLSPRQRGSMMGINKPGATDCILLKGPCGERTGMPTTGVKAGTNFTVLIQKNLDHWDKATPGYFTVSWGLSETSMTMIAKVQDNGEPSLYIYEVEVTAPKSLNDHYIMQVTYVTMNKQAPPVFYQCADFGVY
ncbi:unnamed protein product [Owenia fusiformis]|uniref:Uncharacterized protein n=1 Tax=Owenia fusiformis TaxID=6347 RepID=A0A8J1Y0F4_OWEFU|nr:unnamed protein product [Owenia fusiformis]